MRNLLHFGLFALALTAVSQASADDDGDYRRGRKVIVTYDDGPRQVRPVRSSFATTRAVYDQRRTFHNSANAMQVARRDYFDQREDLEQIVRISERWKWATATANPHAQWKIDRRLDAWLERELRESVRESRGLHHQQRLRSLREELARLERSRYRGHGYRARGHRGHRGHGYWKHGRGGHAANKALILDELVRLAERQVQRAAANLHHPYRFSIARR